MEKEERSMCPFVQFPGCLWGGQSTGVFRTSSPLQVTTCTAAEDSTHTPLHSTYIRGHFSWPQRVCVQGPGIWETETVMEQALLVALRTSWWTVTPILEHKRHLHTGVRSQGFHHILQVRKTAINMVPRQKVLPNGSGRWLVLLPEQESSKYNDPYLTRHWLNVSLAPGINRMLPQPGNSTKNLKRLLSMEKMWTVLYIENLAYRFRLSCSEWKCLAAL